MATTGTATTEKCARNKNGLASSYFSFSISYSVVKLAAQNSGFVLFRLAAASHRARTQFQNKGLADVNKRLRVPRREGEPIKRKQQKHTKRGDESAPESSETRAEGSLLISIATNSMVLRVNDDDCRPSDVTSVIRAGVGGAICEGNYSTERWRNERGLLP